MIHKICVHNLFEAKALLKEYDEQDQFFEEDLAFYSHTQGKYLGTSIWVSGAAKHAPITPHILPRRQD